ncbi:LemA family protein [Oceanotoga teriensis]|uniref:LemA family protein n=1 Tax=Oceanotoga teriensis TaxID=515440 RepID=UPI002713A5C1|nr:LemA family protein [Oceanotoga teriensis]MDO7977317.1 LemA family protein [Oceanotoga teriensis]
MKKGLILVLVIIGLFAIGIFGWYFSTYNSLVNLNESLDSNWAEIENQLMRRADLIPNLVNTVKGYASQEKEIFTQVSEARAKLIGAQTTDETMKAAGEMNSALSRLLAISESYPELKSDKVFIQLIDELSGTENRISVSRKRYNDSIRDYNSKIKRFPTNIISGNLGYETREYFEVPSYSYERPEVSF